MTGGAFDQSADSPLPARRSNRPVTALHVIEYGLMQGASALFRLIGLDASSALAGSFMRTVGPLIAPISKRGDDNLKVAFPDMAKDERARILAGVWENLGRTVAEFAHLDKFDIHANDGRVELVGVDAVEEYVRGGKPAIYASGHFANWELMAIALRQSGVDSAIIYRAANNPLIDGMIIKTRAQVMSRLQIPKGKRGGRQVMDALKEGRSLAILVDQKLNDGISVPFMGREAKTAPAAARLSLKFGIPIITSSVERLNGARFRLTVHPPIEFTPTGDAAADTRALTILVNERIERDIRARPDQWLWLHRRWAAPKEKKKRR
jgi:KDO2-lipid IV(A) lauroyltransferase